MSILSARGLSKAYGARSLFDGISLTVEPGDRIGLLGMNGAGKSTLLRVIAGLEPADAGTVDKSRDAEVRYLPQEPELPADETPRAIVSAGLAAWHKAKARHAELSRLLDAHTAGPEAIAAAVAEQAALGEAIERLGGWERGHLVDEMLTKLGVREPDRAVGSMSGGERRRVALAALLVAEPHLAILDEPTNHLDADTIEWLETYLADQFRGAVLLVTHDRYVLDAIATQIVELEGGALTAYQGNYGDYLEQKAERMAHADRVESNRLNFLRRERAWLMRGAKARSTKQKARIQRAEAAIAIEAPREAGRVQLEAQSSDLGKTILDLKDVTLTLGGKRLLAPLTLHMVGGDRIGILGPNGAGKTSLLKLVSGELTPTSGTVVRGVQTKIAYFDQARAQLDDEATVFENVADLTRHGGAIPNAGGMVKLGDRTIEMRTYLEQFLFDGSKQRQKVGSLSGGERARVALAKTMRMGANLLLLDEPTNDLDIATLGALEEMLTGWNGCALVVSHDRYFLNRAANSILAFEADGKVVRYPGNYDTYRSLKDEAAALTREVAAEASEAAKKKPEARSAATAPAASAPPQAAGKKPLTYAERIELEKIFDRIGEAEEKVRALEQALEDPALYTTRPAEVKDFQARLAAAQAEMQALTARWEDLESRRS